MPVRDLITNKKQLNKQKMAINGSWGTKHRNKHNLEIWNKEILDVSAAFVPEIKHINNHFGIWRPRHKKSEFSIHTKSGSDGIRINAARFVVTQSI